jgi:hypothetical protein
MKLITRRRSASLGIILFIALTTLHGAGTREPAVSGEVIETYCWAKLGIAGPSHTSCGIECAKRGIPVGVLDRKTRKVFILLPGRDKSSVPPELVAAMGQRVDIQGEIVSAGGANFVSVQSWELYKSGS